MLDCTHVLLRVQATAYGTDHEYFIGFIMTVLRILAEFASPVGISKLLKYVQLTFNTHPC